MLFEVLYYFTLQDPEPNIALSQKKVGSEAARRAATRYRVTITAKASLKVVTLVKTDRASADGEESA